MKRGIHLIAGIAIGALLATVTFAISSRKTTLQDPVKQSPQYYKVLLENEQVRVVEYRLKPGEKEPMHTHTAGVVYVFADARMRASYPDGRTQESSGGAGEFNICKKSLVPLESRGSTAISNGCVVSDIFVLFILFSLDSKFGLICLNSSLTNPKSRRITK